MKAEEVLCLYNREIINPSLIDMWGRSESIPNPLRQLVTELSKAKRLERVGLFTLILSLLFGVAIVAIAIFRIHQELSTAFSVLEAILITMGVVLILIARGWLISECQLGIDLKTLVSCLTVNSGGWQKLHLTMDEIEALAQYELRVLAGRVLYFEKNEDRGSDNATTSRVNFDQAHKIFIKFGIVRPLKNIYFDDPIPINTMTAPVLH